MGGRTRRNGVSCISSHGTTQSPPPRRLNHVRHSYAFETAGNQMDASCKLHPRDQFGQTNPTLFLRLNGQGATRELAWEEFHRAYAPIIAGFARKLGAPKAEVEDVVQEVMTG